MLNTKIQEHIDNTVLCWLATTDKAGCPNVSPKELFTHYRSDRIIIANIASPQSVRNIRANPRVCVSWIDIFTQKGYKAKGNASIIGSGDVFFEEKAAKLKLMAGTAFHINMLIDVELEALEELVAPRYRFYPNTTEEEQIADAMKSYRVQTLL